MKWALIFVYLRNVDDIVGPNRHTVADLWRMVWQERVDSIVMLANLVEDGKVSQGQQEGQGQREGQLEGQGQREGQGQQEGHSKILKRKNPF